jgi:DNA-binding MarR family transcriptional regulator
MATRRSSRQTPVTTSSAARKIKPDTTGAGNQKDRLLREIAWNMAAINACLEDIRQIWADALGVSGPQWLILMAIEELDADQGVSVGEVSTKIQVHPSFVTTQTKELELAGYLSRKTSPIDARIILMSLTDKAQKGISRLFARRSNLSASIFADLNDRTLREFTESLALIRRRIEKAALQLELDRS